MIDASRDSTKIVPEGIPNLRLPLVNGQFISPEKRRSSFIIISHLSCTNYRFHFHLYIDNVSDLIQQGLLHTLHVAIPQDEVPEGRVVFLSNVTKDDGHLVKRETGPECRTMTIWAKMLM